jgi:NADH dehydrogenase FAD-containing subunit
MPEHVVIAGGGFGGLFAARRLLKVMPPQSV